MKFAHLGDCHLGGWRQPELKDLNLKSFQYAISKCILEKVDFVLIAGDLFDSAYPPIETLKETFFEFKRLKEANIPAFIIAGSHDYSVSGKTFLDVLEKAGLCRNLSRYEERENMILLSPTIFKNAALYGYSGKKSSLEIDDIQRMKLQDAPGMFKILMLHTAIRDAIGTLPIEAVNERELPIVDYLALGHLHINYQKGNRTYSGPIFPNNLSELEELRFGQFYLFDNGRISKQEIKLKEIVIIEKQINNALFAADEILSEISKLNVSDKIIILKLSGILEQGKTSDINFQKIELEAKKRGAYCIIRSISKVRLPEPEIKLDYLNTDQLESQIIKSFEEKNPSRFNVFIKELSKVLQVEKLEDERSSIFEDRLISETKRVLEL
jgi:DNA repair exonuclease SbcCD nuclease subunit